jgi:hypothetical protein
MAGSSFLIEGGAPNPVGITRHRDWPTYEMRQQDRSDRRVVLDEVALGIPIREEGFVEV